MGIFGVDQNICQSVIRIDIHIQNGNPAADFFVFTHYAVDDLCITLQLHPSREGDFQLRDDHTGQQNPFMCILINGKAAGGAVAGLQLYISVHKRMIEFKDWSRNQFLAKVPEMLFWETFVFSINGS